MDPSVEPLRQRSIALARGWLQHQAASTGIFILYIGMGCLVIASIVSLNPILAVSPIFIVFSTSAVTVPLGLVKRWVWSARRKQGDTDWKTPVPFHGQQYIKRFDKVKTVLHRIMFWAGLLAVISTALVPPALIVIPAILYGIVGVAVVCDMYWNGVNSGLWEYFLLASGLLFGFIIYGCLFLGAVPFAFGCAPYLTFGFSGVLSGLSLHARWTQIVREKLNVAGWIW